MVPGNRSFPTRGLASIVTLPPRLYHGTIALHEDAIISEGLRPSHDGGNAPDTWPTRPGYVYLTDVNGFHYACSSAIYNNYQHDAMIVEIDSSYIDPDLLYPDGEYLAQTARALTNEETKHAFDPEFDPLSHKDKWMESLQYLGSVGYRGSLPADAIIRIARITTAHVRNAWALQSHVLIKTREFDFPLREAMTAFIFDSDADMMRRALEAAFAKNGSKADPEAELRKVGVGRHITVRAVRAEQIQSTDEP